MTHRTCLECSKVLHARAKGSYCKAHMHLDTDANARRKAANKMRYAADPKLRELARLNAKIGANTPAEQERRRNSPHLKAMGEKGRASITREAMDRRNRLISETRMAWCPPELRDLARSLTGKKIPLAQVQALIADQHEKNMAEFRRKLEAA